MKFEGQIECISILRVVGALGIALYHGASKKTKLIQKVVRIVGGET